MSVAKTPQVISVMRPRKEQALERPGRDIIRWGGAFQSGLPLAAALFLVVSIFLPYWHLTLHAPQYPGGLDLTAFVNRLSGDVEEIDGLNHYIGMRKLDTAGRVERLISVYAIPLMAVATAAFALLRSKWAWVLGIPVVVFPLVFIGDLFFWLYDSGHDLDPTAALSSSIEPFTPAVFGNGRVGQFETTANFEAGFYLALLAAIGVLAAYFLRWRAGKRGA